MLCSWGLPRCHSHPRISCGYLRLSSGYLRKSIGGFLPAILGYLRLSWAILRLSCGYLPAIFGFPGLSCGYRPWLSSGYVFAIFDFPGLSLCFFKVNFADVGPNFQWLLDLWVLPVTVTSPFLCWHGFCSRDTDGWRLPAWTFDDGLLQMRHQRQPYSGWPLCLVVEISKNANKDCGREKKL